MSEKEIDYQFGLRLSDLREKRGMTQANLAEKMDAPRTEQFCNLYFVCIER